MGLEVMEITMRIEEVLEVNIYEALFEPPAARLDDRSPRDITVQELYDLVLKQARRDTVVLQPDSWETFLFIVSDCPTEEIRPYQLISRDLGAGW